VGKSERRFLKTNKKITSLTVIWASSCKSAAWLQLELHLQGRGLGVWPPLYQCAMSLVASASSWIRFFDESHTSGKLF